MPPLLSPADYKIDPQSLCNTYFAVRHGEAHSNLAGVLCSSGSEGAGAALTPKGVTQIRQGAHEFAQRYLTEATQCERVVIFSSPLSRAFESAKLIREILEKKFGVEISLTPHAALRERGYGELESQPVAEWNKLKQADLLDFANAPWRAESVGALHARLHALFLELEQNFKGRMILLVSHCDPIQVMQSILSSETPGHYSEVEQLKNGSWVKLSCGKGVSLLDG